MTIQVGDFGDFNPRDQQTERVKNYHAILTKILGNTYFPYLAREVEQRLFLLHSLMRWRVRENSKKEF